MTMLCRWYSMVNSYNKNYADFGNGVGIQTDNLRTTDTDWFRTKGAVSNTEELIRLRKKFGIDRYYESEDEIRYICFLKKKAVDLLSFKGKELE